jgi:hypothetical protein
MGACEVPAVLFHLVGAEQLCPQWRFAVGRDPAHTMQSIRPFAQGVTQRVNAQFHFRFPSPP